ncbi:UDP-N-acetylmuramoyl-L-alanyl-D-glutamate--2,6-diaminopimelate ligase [Propionibacteriaceae bacterium Y1923]
MTDNPPSWHLRDLLADAGLEPSEASDQDPAITGLAFDSRRVRAGDLYLAMPGANAHGAQFAAAAVDRGAVAILTDPRGVELAGEVLVPVVSSQHPRQAMAAVAQSFHHHPWRRAPMFAVTGTNGKTTTTLLLEAGLTALGKVVGSIGTLGFRLGGQPVEWTSSTVTTPEAPDLQHLFTTMLDAGADTIAMEVSSHALALSRVAGTRFAVAGFTMLGRDHLDFHRDLDDYFATKATLFTGDPLVGADARDAVVCTDQDWGRRLAGMIKDRPLTTVGRDGNPDVRIVSSSAAGPGRQQVELDLRGRRIDFELSMPGSYNVTNAALALAMIDAAGFDAARAATGLAHAAVPGRMQHVPLGPGAPGVIVDFAHTPQAVAEALAAVEGPGRRVVVLGAGGDRDAEKRPEMGRAAAAAADIVVVTDDNPRSEDPAAIRAAVVSGTQGQNAQVLDVPGRRQAITRALELAGPDDLVLLLGKGHERGQQLADRVIDFDDVEVARECWTALTGGR